MSSLRSFLIAFLCVPIFAVEFPARLVVNSVESQTPLNQKTVESILEDNYGYIWLGTQGGLHFYDGQAYIVVNTSNEYGREMFDDFVLSITETSENNLWFATLEGLNFLNRSSLKASGIATYEELGVVGTPRHLKYFNRQLLLITDDGAYSINSETLSTNRVFNTKNVKRVEQQRKNKSSATYLLLEDQTLTTLSVPSESIKLPRKMTSLAVSNENIFGISNSQLVKLDFEGTELSTFELPSDENIRIVAFDKNQLWINIGRKSLVTFNILSEDIKVFSASNSNLKDFNIRSALVSSDNLIWLGSATSGLFVHSTDSQNFRFLSPHINKQNEAVNSIRDIQIFDNEIVLATEGGLAIFDEELERQVLGSNYRIFSFQLFDQEHFIVGAEQGLFLINRFTGVTNRVGDLDEIRKVIKVDDLWLIATEENGIIVLDSELNQLSNYDSLKIAGEEQSLGLILNLIYDHYGYLWALTVDGLYRVKFEQGKIKGDARWMLPTIITRDLEFLSNGEVLIATHSGLFKININSGLYNVNILYNATNGLLDNIVYTVVARDNILWLATPYGITQIDEENNEFKYFDDPEQLGQAEFNGSVKYVKDESIYFGGLRGVTKVKIDELDLVSTKQTWINRVSFGQNFNQNIYFPKEQIDLLPDQKNLLISFSKVNFNHLLPTKYRYRVSGGPWAELSSESQFIIGDLKSGRSIIEVQSKMGNEEWRDAKNSLKVNIAYKTYSSPLAIALYIIAGCTLVVLVLYQEYRRRVMQRENHRQVVSSEARLKLALKASGYGLWDWDIKENTMLRLNSEHLFPITEGKSDTHDTDDYIHRKDLENVLTEHRRFLQEGGEFDVQYRVKDSDHNWLWIHDKGKVIEVDEQGNITRAVGTYSDVTDFKRAHLESVLSNEIIRNMTEGLVVLDQNKQVSFVNPAFSRITGYGIGELRGKSLRLLQSTKHSDEFYDKLWAAINQSGAWFGEFWINSANNREILCSTEVFHIDDDELDEHLTVLIISNITEKRIAEEKLSQLARYDSLTGLPNRNLLLDRLEHALAIAKRHGHNVAVMFIDLDGFKKINDSFGHQSGDKVLVEVSKQISKSIRDEDTLARLSGDEFLLIIEDYASRETIEKIAKKILKKLNRPLSNIQNQMVITASIGIACYPDDAETVETILQYSDTAMYHAKKNGKNDFAFYQKEMHVNLVQRLKIENFLREAVIDNQLYVLFQPIVHTESNQVRAAEALVRWSHPILGEVFPSEFIPLAEESGHILEIGYFVLEKVCEQIAKLAQYDISIAVNVSVRQLMDDKFINKVERAIVKHKISPEKLKIEITESLLMTNPRHAASVLRALKAIGVIVSVDDFGTGYSSLSYLKRFSIDELKIDKEFIADIKNEDDQEDIVNAILALAKSLNMRVVAEGVETHEQVKYLRTQSCDYLQGYLFSRPILSDDILDFISSFNKDNNI